MVNFDFEWTTNNFYIIFSAFASDLKKKLFWWTTFFLDLFTCSNNICSDWVHEKLNSKKKKKKKRFSLQIKFSKIPKKTRWNISTSQVLIIFTCFLWLCNYNLLTNLIYRTWQCIHFTKCLCVQDINISVISDMIMK